MLYKWNQNFYMNSTEFPGKGKKSFGVFLVSAANKLTIFTSLDAPASCVYKIKCRSHVCSVNSYLLCLSLQRPMTGDCVFWSLLPPGENDRVLRGVALLGEDSTLTGRESWGEWGRAKGQGRVLCSWRTTGQQRIFIVNSNSAWF